MLKAEDKRWTVVGICLSKVLTPAMRGVMEQEIQQLYQQLVLPPTHIHSQTSASYLKSLPPSTMRLNYVNINNNTTKPSHHSYDYCVKDEVSLAKLFVRPFMSSFTGFDESLDSSAALSILCGAPNFVKRGIDIISMDVRDKVRNEWGHCKFATWTEDFYLKCFRLMEKLIKSLNLPAVSEVKVLEDLQEWKSRGIDMCFGQQSSSDVLKLVQKEMAILSTSVEENKESWVQDHEGLRNNLTNLTELFSLDIKKLEAKHVALESGLNFLKEDQMKMKETVAKSEIVASSNASLIQHVKDSFEEERKGLHCRQELLEGKVTGLSQGIDRLVSREENVQTRVSGLHWKIPVAILLSVIATFLYEMYLGGCGVFQDWYSRAEIHWKILVVTLLGGIVTFLYQRYSRGSVLRYWFCRRGCIPGHTLSFVYKTFDKQTPTVNGVEFEWEALKNKLGLTFDPIDAPGMHYYLNIDRCAYGGVVTVSSYLDNTPQVRGAEIVAVNPECTQVYYHDDGAWNPYISARDIRCTPARK